MQVRVYRNLRHGHDATPLYSVLYRGRVIQRKQEVLISGATFVVREGGRQRVLKEKRKNVHAFVVGTLTDERGAFGIDAQGPDLPVRISYNPYKAGYFLTEQGHRVKGAAAVLLNARGITACYLDCDSSGIPNTAGAAFYNRHED